MDCAHSAAMEVAMQFVVIATHSPDMCPTSNSKIREMLQQGGKEIPHIADKLGVKIITLNVFGPDHQLHAVVEADDIEKVRNFLMESRMVQWNTAHVHPTWTIEEAISRASQLPAIF